MADSAPGVLAPAPDLDRTEARVRSLFDEFYDRFDDDVAALLDRPPLFVDDDSFLLGPAGLAGPRADLRDRGDRYELVLDVPGADESQVSIEVTDGVLVVSGSRSSSLSESEPGTYVRRERQFGRFERRLRLPADADPDSLESTYEDGVLRIELEKRT